MAGDDDVQPHGRGAVDCRHTNLQHHGLPTRLRLDVGRGLAMTVFQFWAFWVIVLSILGVLCWWNPDI